MVRRWRSCQLELHGQRDRRGAILTQLRSGLPLRESSTYQANTDPGCQPIVPFPPQRLSGFQQPDPGHHRRVQQAFKDCNTRPRWSREARNSLLMANSCNKKPCQSQSTSPTSFQTLLEKSFRIF